MEKKELAFALVSTMSFHTIAEYKKLASDVSVSFHGILEQKRGKIRVEEVNTIERRYRPNISVRPHHYNRAYPLIGTVLGISTAREAIYVCVI